MDITSIGLKEYNGILLVNVLVYIENSLKMFQKDVISFDIIKLSAVFFYKEMQLSAVY